MANSVAYFNRFIVENPLLKKPWWVSESKWVKLTPEQRADALVTVRDIEGKWTDAKFTVDEGADENFMRRNGNHFFDKVGGRKREVFETYRGFIIVRYTRGYSNGVSERVTTLYAFGKWSSDPNDYDFTYCDIPSNSSVTQAKREADRVLRQRTFASAAD